MRHRPSHVNKMFLSRRYQRVKQPRQQHLGKSKKEISQKATTEREFPSRGQIAIIARSLAPWPWRKIF